MRNPTLNWKIKWADAHRRQASTVYERVLGTRFLHLPVIIRHLHKHMTYLSGRVDVKHGRHWLARPIAHWLGLPAEGVHQPLVVGLERNGDLEIWRRWFGGQRFVSKQFVDNGLLCEQLGPLRLTYALFTDGQTLDLDLLHTRLFGIRLPRAWAPQLTAQEWPLGGGIGFSVSVTLPLVGSLIRYVGSVRPTTNPIAHEHRDRVGLANKQQGDRHAV